VRSLSRGTWTTAEGLGAGGAGGLGTAGDGGAAALLGASRGAVAAPIESGLGLSGDGGALDSSAMDPGTIGLQDKGLPVKSEQAL